jgi:antitoxin FitA
MADIILRNLDEALKQGLRERAGRHGRSMSAELREIVRAALSQPDTDVNANFKKLAAKLRKRGRGRKQTPAWILQREGRDER